MGVRRLARLAVAGVLGLAAAGCASIEAYEKLLEGWVGKHSDVLVESWGPPDSTYEFRDGRRALQYVDRRTRYDPPITSYNPSTGNREIAIEGYFQEFSCITTFETDPGGIVRSWKWKGNGCAIVPDE